MVRADSAWTAVVASMSLNKLEGMKRAIGWIAAAEAMSGGKLFPDIKARPIKKCRNCGKEHQHHNMYCSTSCCKVDKI